MLSAASSTEPIREAPVPELTGDHRGGGDGIQRVAAEADPCRVQQEITGPGKVTAHDDQATG